MSILTRIHNLAKKQGVTIAQIEKETNLGNGLIRRWETSSPSCDKLLRVANFLNTDINYLVTGTEDYKQKLSNDEKELLAGFKDLDLTGKSAVMQTILREQERINLQKNQTRNTNVG